MALIKCDKCGREISDTSKKCIHCGNIINKKIICSECGKEISADLCECSNCGFKLKSTKKKLKSQKKLFLLLIPLLILLILLLLNMNKVKIPDLYKVSEESAISILQNNGLIPQIVYEYNDLYDEGIVFNTVPYSGEKIDKNSTVIVYVSKGPSSFTSLNSTIEWYHINSNNPDEWTFNSPYIMEDYLYIDCTSTFGTSFTWEGFGTASINDTFSKKVPVNIITDNEKVVADKETSFTLKVSVADLDVKKPTTLYMKLVVLDKNQKQIDININFSISW